MAIKTLISSFNAGELSPLLESRMGVEKVAAGCRVMQNFIPHVHGAVFRRPGLEFMGLNGPEGAPSRIIGFNFSTTTNFILELAEGELHVWHSGGKMSLVAPVLLPYQASELFEVQAAQINDVVYLVHPNHWPLRLTRYADDDWRAEPLFAALSGGTVVPGYTVTGEFGKAQFSRWPWSDYSGPNFDLDNLIPNVLASGPPATYTTVSSLYLTSGPTNTGIRLEFDLIVPATGTWTWAWQGSGRIFVDDVVKDSNMSGAARSFSMSMVGGQRYKVVYWKFTAATPSVTRLRLSGPGYPLADVPASWFKLWDTEVPGNYSQADFVNQWPPMLDENVTPTTIEASATAGTNVTLVATEGIFRPDHVGGYWQIAHRRDSALSEYVGAVGAFAGSSTAIKVLGRWDIFTYGTWAGTLKLERQSATSGWETVRSWKSNKDRNVVATGESVNQEILRLTVVSGDGEAASGAAVPRFILEAADAKIYGLVKIVAVPAPAATVITAVADNGGGLIRVTSVAHGLTSGQRATVAGVVGSGGLPAAIHGTWEVTVIDPDTVDLVGSAFTGSYTSDGTIVFAAGTEATVDVVRELASTAATDLWTEGAWSTWQGFPRAIALHEQRLFFGGTRRQPQRIWGSTAADIENFRRSNNDDGALDFVMAAQESNAIQWMVSQGALIVGTAGEEWTVSASGSDAPLTPINLKVQRQTRFGSAYQQALLVNEVAVFIQRTGRRLRQFQYSEATDGYTAADLTVLAEHITRSGIKQMAFQTQKQSILWAVTNDGRLIGMTFEAEQNVFAWHEHVFEDSQIESVAVIYGERTDEVWVVTSRINAGEKEVREMMRLHPGTAEFDTIHPHHLNYLDCSSVVVLSPPDDVVTGLERLNNQTVHVVIDGAEHPPATVIDGEITLERDASTVVVGLPMTSTLQPMPQDLPLQDGTAQGRAWKAPRVALRVYRSMAGEAAAADGRNFEPVITRTPADPMDTAVPLFTGEKRLHLESRSEDKLAPIVRQAAPFPFNLSAMVTTFDVYDR